MQIIVIKLKDINSKQQTEQLKETVQHTIQRLEAICQLIERQKDLTEYENNSY